MNWENIEGYFSYTNLYDIAIKYCQENSTFVEIGSWMGRSTCYMGEKIKNSSKNIQFYAVDTWAGSEELHHKETIEKLNNQNLTLFDVFKYNLNLCEISDYVIPIQATSLNAAEQFEDNSLDFVHIDASHDYINVLADICAWYPKVKPGGFITGDDYVSNWGGVIQAVTEYFTDKSVVLLDRGDLTLNKVWLHQKEGEQMNITLYAIAKNEEKNIERFINISKKFKHTIVVDTGSTDNTVKLLKDSGIEVYEHSQSREEFDFAKARNQALSYVKTDWAFSLDFNEDLEEFFPEGLGVISEEFTVFKHDRYDKNDESEPIKSNEVHTRFHRTQNYTWTNSVHEVLMFVPTEQYLNEVSVDITTKITKNIHKTIDKKLFYLSICEREYEKDPTNWYYVWFIFNHYFEVRNINKALEYGQEFLNLSKSYFNTFRVPVFISCSQILFNLGDIQKASNYAFHALSEAMNMGEPHLSQAFSYLTEVSKKLNNPNITIFATGFSQNTIKLPERHSAIDKLFLTNLDDIPATAWSGHRVFAEWIVSHMNPEITVDLGVDYGFSTFAFAIPRIGKVYGIDNFVGDDFIGRTVKGKYDYVMMKREKLHLQDNLTFIEGDFDEVAKTWNQPIDILHIDGSHYYEDIKKDYGTWSQFVSDNGVILLHDTCISSLNENEYGVKRFFEEIDLPKTNFTECYGLGVISKDSELIKTIKDTFNL
jgi:glycosyltransferase involved in cell wall biosynthesis